MKILVIAPIVPYPLRDGDRIRLYHLIKAMSRKNKVSLLACTRDPEGSFYARELAAELHLDNVEVFTLSSSRLILNCLKNFFSFLPFNVSAYQWNTMKITVKKKIDQMKFDLIFVYRLRMAPAVSDFSIPKVIDLTDALTIYMERAALISGNPFKRIYFLWESAKMKKYEPRVCGLFNACLISSPRDLEHLQKKGVKNLYWVSNGVNIKNFKFRLKGRKKNTLLFTGNMGYTPNQQGILFFIEKIWPLIRKVKSEATIQIVGGQVPSWIKSWNGKEGIEVAGEVSSMAPYLQEATLFVCPLLLGAGVRFKILEAFASGLPVVSTSLGCEGLQVTNGREIMVADNPESFAQAVLDLLKRPKLRKVMSQRAYAVCKKYYDWTVIEKKLEVVLKKVL